MEGAALPPTCIDPHPYLTLLSRSLMAIDGYRGGERERERQGEAFHILLQKKSRLILYKKIQKSTPPCLSPSPPLIYPVSDTASVRGEVGDASCIRDGLRGCTGCTGTHARMGMHGALGKMYGRLGMHGAHGDARRRTGVQLSTEER